jgi:hypothetical protein
MHKKCDQGTGRVLGLGFGDQIFYLFLRNDRFPETIAVKACQDRYPEGGSRALTLCVSIPLHPRDCISHLETLADANLRNKLPELATWLKRS